MAPPLSPCLLRSPKRKENEGDRGGLTCEIARILPESLSHDWHVQPSCQRPNRTPPERREFSPGELARMRIRLSSKPYKHTVRRKILSTSTSHRLSTCFAHAGSSSLGRVQESCQLKPRFLATLGMTWLSMGARMRATVWSSALA